MSGQRRDICLHSFRCKFLNLTQFCPGGTTLSNPAVSRSGTPGNCPHRPIFAHGRNTTGSRQWWNRVHMLTKWHLSAVYDLARLYLCRSVSTCGKIALVISKRTRKHTDLHGYETSTFRAEGSPHVIPKNGNHLVECESVSNARATQLFVTHHATRIPPTRGRVRVWPGDHRLLWTAFL